MNEEVKFFTNDSINFLIAKLEEEVNRKKYVDSKYFDLSEIEFLESGTGIAFDKDFQLLNGRKNDAINAINLHKTLKGLDYVQANDKRLWVSLAHTKFFSYSVDRWNASKERAIKDRFFYEGSSIRTRISNSISRLWWTAELTFDNEKVDKYELTKSVFSMQDLFLSLFDRKLVTYPNIVKTWISIAQNNSHLSSRDLQLIPKGLNALGGTLYLGGLTREEVEKHIHNIAAFNEIDIIF